MIRGNHTLARCRDENLSRQFAATVKHGILVPQTTFTFQSACVTKRFPSPQCASTIDLALIAVVAQISPSHNDKDQCRRAKDDSYA